MFNPSAHPHRRYNPLTRQWVIVSPHRTERPWQGQVEPAPAGAEPPYDAACYLCPGNERAGGARNPAYAHTFVFDNDFPALRPDGLPGQIEVGDLIVARAERGVCRVVCFSPRHDLTLATLSSHAMRRVVDAWCEQYDALRAIPHIEYVQIFENRGAMMGASNPHPHGQIWACETVPNEPAIEQASLHEWRTARGRCMLCDYLALELEQGERVVVENAHWVVLVPFWAIWPFEVLVLPRRHADSLRDLALEERGALADVLQRIARRYDQVFDAPFPYSMGFHQSPVDDAFHPEWHMHAHFYPPLLRSASVRKFLVGFEMLAAPQRDITPEQAATCLRRMTEQPLEAASCETQHATLDDGRADRSV